MAFTPTFDTPQLQAANFGGIGNAAITAANTAKDGTGTVTTIFEAHPDNGSQVFRIRAVPIGTNVPSVLRIFVNNGSATTTATNNVLWREFALPATTLTETGAQDVFCSDSPLRMPPGYKLTATLGTAVSAGWAVSVEGADY